MTPHFRSPLTSKASGPSPFWLYSTLTHFSVATLLSGHEPPSDRTWTRVVPFWLVHLLPLLSYPSPSPQSNLCSFLSHITPLLSPLLVPMATGMEFNHPPYSTRPYGNCPLPAASASTPRWTLLPHWPGSCHVNTPTRFPSRGLCSCFLQLRTFLKQTFVDCTLCIP